MSLAQESTYTLSFAAVSPEDRSAISDIIESLGDTQSAGWLILNTDMSDLVVTEQGVNIDKQSFRVVARLGDASTIADSELALPIPVTREGVLELLQKARERLAGKSEAPAPRLQVKRAPRPEDSAPVFSSQKHEPVITTHPSFMPAGLAAAGAYYRAGQSTVSVNPWMKHFVSGKVDLESFLPEPPSPPPMAPPAPVAAQTPAPSEHPVAPVAPPAMAAPVAPQPIAEAPAVNPAPMAPSPQAVSAPQTAPVFHPGFAQDWPFPSPLMQQPVAQPQPATTHSGGFAQQTATVAYPATAQAHALAVAPMPVVAEPPLPPMPAPPQEAVILPMPSVQPDGQTEQEHPAPQPSMVQPLVSRLQEIFGAPDPAPARPVTDMPSQEATNGIAMPEPPAALPVEMPQDPDLPEGLMELPADPAFANFAWQAPSTFAPPQGPETPEPAAAITPVPVTAPEPAPMPAPVAAPTVLDPWAESAITLYSIVQNSAPVIAEMNIAATNSVLIDFRYRAFVSDEPIENLPCNPSRVLIRTEVAQPGQPPAIPLPGTGIDQLLWYVGINAFDGKPAPWIRSEDRYRLQRWPNFTEITYQMDHMRMTALIGNAFMNAQEMADAAGVPIETAVRMVNAYSLMGLLQTAVVQQPAVAINTQQQPLASRSVNGFFSKLRDKLGL